MKYRQWVLELVRRTIHDTEHHIKWSENAMRTGLPPTEIECLRGKLAQLRAGERQSIRLARSTEPPMPVEVERPDSDGIPLP